MQLETATQLQLFPFFSKENQLLLECVFIEETDRLSVAQ
jgi:hypothetical protein